MCWWQSHHGGMWLWTTYIFLIGWTTFLFKMRIQCGKPWLKGSSNQQNKTRRVYGHANGIALNICRKPLTKKKAIVQTISAKYTFCWVRLSCYGKGVIFVPSALKAAFSIHVFSNATALKFYFAHINHKTPAGVFFLWPHITQPFYSTELIKATS